MSFSSVDRLGGESVQCQKHIHGSINDNGPENLLQANPRDKLFGNSTQLIRRWKAASFARCPAAALSAGSVRQEAM